MLQLHCSMGQSVIVMPSNRVVSAVTDYSFDIDLGSNYATFKCLTMTLPSQLSIQGSTTTNCSADKTSFSPICKITSSTSLTIESSTGSFPQYFIAYIGSIVNYKYATFVSNFSLDMSVSCSTQGTVVTFTTLSFTPGTFTTKSVTPGSYKVYDLVVYTFSLVPQHNIDQNGRLYFTFPTSSYSIQVDSSLVARGYIGAAPSTIPTLTVTQQSTNGPLIVSGLFSSKEYTPTDGVITITFTSIRNPTSVKQHDSITVESRNPTGELTINSVNSGLEVNIVTPCDLVRSRVTQLDNTQVRISARYTFYASSVLPSATGATLEITLPSTIVPSSVTCTYTFLTPSSSTTCTNSGQVITVTNVSFSTNIILAVSNIRNPTTDITSSAIKFYIYDSSRNIICRNDSFDTITATTGTPTNVSARRPTTVVGESGNFEISFKFATTLDSTAQFEIRIPRNQVDLNVSSVSNVMCYSNGITDISVCSLANSITTSEIILTIYPSCGTSCTASSTATLTFTGLRNPYIADNTVTSSVKIYTYIPGTPNGYVDKIETGVKFQSDLTSKILSSGTIARNTNIVGTSATITVSFAPTIPYATGFKLVVEFPQSASYAATQAITGEASFTSNFASKTTLTCSSTTYSSDSSIYRVTCTGATQSSTITDTIYFRLFNLVNRYDTQELSGSYTLYINTSGDFGIEQGTLAQSSSLGVFTTSTISNISISRTDNTVYNTTNIVIVFRSSTKLPTTGVITITVPANIIIQNTGQTMECYNGTTKLTCSALTTSFSNGVTSITSLSITDFCNNSGCSAGATFTITLRNLVNPSSVVSLTGNMSIVTNSGSFDVDTGSADVSLTLATLTSGRLFDLDIHPMNPSINQSPSYRFTFTTEHAIPANGYISITWPAQLDTLSSQSITILFGFQSNSVSLEKLTSTINIRNGFPTGTSAPVLVGFYLNIFRHGSAAQTTGTFDISIRNSQGFTVDRDNTKTVTITSLQSSCSSTCNACSGTSSGCYSCKVPSSAPFLSDYSCVETCPTGYFLMTADADNRACIKCNYYCDECVSNDKCTKCKFNSSTNSNYLKWGGDCVSTCPSDTVAVDSICKSNSCTAPCGECSKTDYCLSCSGSSYPVLLSDTGTCYPGASNGVDSCAQGYYQDTSTNTCKKCNYICNDCTGSSSFCTSCTSYYDKQLLDELNDTCVKTCPTGKTIQDGLFCKACDASCDTCINLTATGCDTCPTTGTKYKTTTGKCVADCTAENLKNYQNPTTSKFECIASCPSTGYYDDNGTCKTCLPVCLTCNASDRCVTCNTSGSTPYLQISTYLCVATCVTGEYFYDLNSLKQCVTTCPSPSLKYTNPTTGRNECIDSSSCPSTRYFISNSEACNPCDVTCLTCGGNSSTCLSCNTSGTYAWLTEAHTCVQQCTAPYEYKYTTNTEKRCYQNCPANTVAYDSGTSKDCLTECPAKTFKDNNVCTNCWSTCKTCTGSTGSDCTSCETSGITPYLTDAGGCVATCDNTFYRLDIGGVKRCVNTCTPTYNNYISSTDKLCVTSCPAYTYLTSAKACESCDPSCLTCNGGLANNCVTCDSAGTYPFYDNGYCKTVCTNIQYTYLENGIRYCLDTCPAGTYKLELVSGKSCVSMCPDGYYNNNGFCSVCDTACLRCTGGTNSNCTACKNGYVQYGDTQCLTTCPTGYKNVNSICVLDCKQSGCLVCEVSELDKCTECIDGYLLYNKICYTACPDGTYSALGECNTCNAICKTCTGSTATDCTSCSSGLYLYINQCLTICPTGHTVINGKCVTGCLIPCATCIQDSVTACSTCMPDNPILYNSYCYSVCPTGTYQEDSTCLVCDTTCKECSGPLPTNCLSCRNGYYLNPDNTCQSICPVTLEPDDTTNSCVVPAPEEESEESSVKGFPVYILIAEAGFFVLVLTLSVMLKGANTQKIANFLALMGVVEFSERIMMMFFLPYEDGPFAAILFAITGGFTLGCSVNAMMFLKLYFDPLIESSMTLDMFVSQYKNPFYTVYYLSMLFSINFLRILYGGLFGIALLTVPKTLGTVKAFRLPLEKISFLKVIIVNLPHLAQQIAVLALWPVDTDTFQIAVFGLALNVTITGVYLFDWQRSIWRKRNIMP